MWLLDHNIPHKLRDVLKKFGVEAQTAIFKGWDSLENGALVEAAVSEGFNVILSRDKKFHESAKTSLKKYSQLALVLVLIDQNDSKTYCEDFEKAWKRNPLKPVPGKLVEWP